MKKNKLVVANWKMNPQSSEEAKLIFNHIRRIAERNKTVDLLICPPFPFISQLIKLKYPKNIYFGVQNISSEEKGAFTGEVSALMAKNFGAKFAIVGHSERRAMGESDEIIKKKLEMAFRSGIVPILCIGEKVRDREGDHLEFIKNQIKGALLGLQKKDLLGLLVAYEPVWAIGKSYKESMTPTDVHETTLFIKKVAGEILGKDIADSLKIIYGGSVEAENAAPIMEYGNVSGFLVGHASLVPEQFEIIVKVAGGKK